MGFGHAKGKEEETVSKSQEQPPPAASKGQQEERGTFSVGRGDWKRNPFTNLLEAQLVCIQVTLYTFKENTNTIVYKMLAQNCPI